MGFIRFAIEKPVTVVVGVILIILFGVIAVTTLPIQLTPDVDRPRITVTTRWEGASPQEVEREIVVEQEDKLKSIQGLRNMVSNAVEGVATVELEFPVGADIARALLDVSDKLRQVPEYPENVDEPVIEAGETEGTNAIAWFVLLRTEGSTVAPDDVPLERTLMEEVVKPRLERAKGVSGIGVVGGMEQEVHVKVDPALLAQRRLTLIDVRDAIRRRNVDVSAGDLDQGKRTYTIRTMGKLESLAEIEGIVLARREGKPVYLHEVGTVALGFKEPENIVRSFGEPAIAINAQRESGTNVIDVMEGLKLAVEDVNRDILRPRGLYLLQVYDQTQYIFSAIDLVMQNLWVGGLLAVGVLLLFLRDGRSTLVIALAIPISIIGSFLALNAMGRNLNVVSLAGLAFAVGMVVDNSIVVLENIDRHRREGKTRREAALRGTQEVWGAVLASTLTTLAVFIPVVFIEEEAGQLFRDIAIAISAAVFLSLIVSIVFIPMATSHLGRRRKAAGARPARRIPGLSGLFGLVALSGLFVTGVTALVARINRSVVLRLATVAGITAAAIGLSWWLLPPMSYLPSGDQNLILGFLIPPPGYSTDELTRIGEKIEGRLSPYWKARDGGDLPPELARPAWYEGEDPLPGIRNFFYVARGQAVFMGARSTDERNVKPLIELMAHGAAGVPGVMVFASQRSLFERGLSSGNSIDLEISGDDMGRIQAAALALMGRLIPVFGPPRPEPSNFNLGAPEIQVRMDDARAAELGLSVLDLGFMVRSMIDGAIVSDYRFEGQTIDLKILPSRSGRAIERLEDIPLVTPSGLQVPLGAVAELSDTTAPSEIRHIEERRAVKLVVTPPPGVELSRAMEMLEEDILPEMRRSGAVPEGVSTQLAGTADKLVSTREALQWNFLLALVITYLLMASLFESFLYPFVIMFSVPLAAVGGIVALRIMHEATGQEMDVLTMLGFVILVGTVVNNAILIVHQALNNIRAEGMEAQAAIRESVRTRIRPIFMSTATSVLGMLPLVLFPGAGSELYRGLGSVVVGGLVASTLFTLVVVPTLFSLVIGARRGVARLVASEEEAAPVAGAAR